MADFLKFFRYKDKPPTKGVADFEPDMPRWKLFFKLYARKFPELLGLNALFIAFSIPSLIVSYFLSFYIINENFDLYFGFTIENNLLEMLIPRIVMSLIMVVVPAAALGPVHAGVTYVLRNWGRQEHAYVWWDFKDAVKVNFKQGIAVTLINIALIFIFGIAITVYTSIMSTATNLFTYAAIGFLSIAFCLFLSMNLYIYPLMVSYDMSIKELFKMAYSFAFMKLIPNLLILVGIAVVSLLLFGFYPILGFLLAFSILPITFLYVINFYVDPIIRKFEE